MSESNHYPNLQHLAVIPDGNRRWAKAHLLLPWQGHVEGVKRFWELAEACKNSGIKYLTFWAGSYSNLEKRTKEEVDVLYRLWAEELEKLELMDKLINNKISLKVIGEWEDFARDSSLKQALLDVEKKTEQFTEHRITILFGYDGQREMLSTINKLASKKNHSNNDGDVSDLSTDEFTAQDIHKNLMTASLPDVDFVIRTGGEPHWSAGFLMWQTANSQFYFTDELWPDFKAPQLKTALEDFERRERRMGK